MISISEAVPVAPSRGHPLPGRGQRRWLPVRSLDASHRPAVSEHLLALDRGDRHLRFGHAASDGQIAAYAAGIDFLHDEVFGVFDRRLRLVAMAHLAFASDGLSAEFGVSVQRPLRGRGFGARLFEHAVMHARNRGVSTLLLYLAPENAAMLAVARHAGAELSVEGAEVAARLKLWAHNLSSSEEAAQECGEFDYLLKLHTLRVDKLLQSDNVCGFYDA